jgi:hypothetical protein
MIKKCHLPNEDYGFLDIITTETFDSQKKQDTQACHYACNKRELTKKQDSWQTDDVSNYDVDIQ